MTTHLSDEEIADYRRRELPENELLRVDDHLAACEACRRLLGGTLAGAASAAVRTLVGESSVGMEHPTYEQIEAYVDGRLDAIDRDVIESHVEQCAQCAEDVGDLLAVSTVATTLRQGSGQAGVVALRPRGAEVGSLRPPESRPARSARPAWYVVAALAAAAGLGGVIVWTSRDAETVRQPAPAPAAAPAIAFSLIDGGRTVALDTAGHLAGLPALDPSDRDAIATALQTGRIEVPAEIGALAGSTGTLMGGAAEAERFRPLHPVATAVESSQPVFAWTPLAGARSYAVSLVDSDLNVVARSAAISATRWTPEKPLRRGQMYAWQVRARTRAGDVLAPAPPAPEARFRVLTQADVDRAAAIRATHADSPLARGVLFAHLGLLDDARQALQLVVAANPASAEAKRLLDAIQ